MKVLMLNFGNICDEANTDEATPVLFGQRTVSSCKYPAHRYLGKVGR